MLKKSVFTALIFTNLYAEAPLKKYGGHSVVGDLKVAIVRKPDETFGNADPQKWHYTAKPDLSGAIEEHDAFVKILKDNGVEIVYNDAPLPDHADAIFVEDPSIVTDKGAIILQMGKPLRRGEEGAMKKTYQKLKVPILAELTGKATAEGGDILWLDDKTLAIGRGYRTNDEGIAQIRKAVKKLGVSVLVVDLPEFEGPESCLHLQSLINLVDYKTAVVYKKFLPVSFIQYLTNKNFKLVEVEDEEFATMGPNILAIKPKLVLTIEGNPKIKEKLESEGVKVLTYKGDEISLKAEGASVCLTRAVYRAP